MLRRLLVASFAVVVIAGCGSGSPTGTPASSSTPAPASAGAATSAPVITPTEAPPAEATPAEATTMSAACSAVGIRKQPSSKGGLVVRIAADTPVRVVEVVSGEAYKAGTCGTDGNTWLKIDQVNGKSMKAKYGVAFGYAAAGFFK
jgi:hypothetical protein